MTTYNNRSIDFRYSRYSKIIERDKKFYGRKETQENKTRRLIDEAYTSPANICPRCFTSKSTINNKCFCEDD